MCVSVTKIVKGKISTICEKTGSPIIRTTGRGEFCDECFMHDGHEFKPDYNNNPLGCEICGRHVMDHPDPVYEGFVDECDLPILR